MGMRTVILKELLGVNPPSCYLTPPPHERQQKIGPWFCLSEGMACSYQGDAQGERVKSNQRTLSLASDNNGAQRIEEQEPAPPA